MSDKLKILVVGKGAREHALAWKVSQSSLVDDIFVAPGNGGTAEIAKNIDISETDISRLLDFVLKEKIDVTIVGPESSLEVGIVNLFRSRNLKIFGPTKEAALIETSKDFAKKLMVDNDIPTADYKTFDSYADAKEHIRLIKFPCVIKADGLASGKGVVIANTYDEANRFLYEQMIEEKFGSAGKKVIIEEFLIGEEVSVFTFVDGKNISNVIAACDYKKLLEGDLGPNTGGMGAYSPPTYWNHDLSENIKNKIIYPTINALSNLGTPYSGILYSGLILTENGPKVLEFNCRFGDPEAQTILPLLKTDLADLILKISDNKLNDINVQWADKNSVSIVLASGGYPEKYVTGYTIDGIEEISDSVLIFHAGTDIIPSSKLLVTNGGRVLTLTSLGNNLNDARNKVYLNLSNNILFENMFYRKDIAI
ncbi:MAG: phosphoribosylamine--glycine ligase [Chloroflexi bacterium]|nr:phosphoribosylamine--glycine ligase [Chloroflexota bacterium]|tara:strand:+ start:35354 stop:36625 length:1272 start_codon:yes stop_codon:yes gene_type:complete